MRPVSDFGQTDPALKALLSEQAAASSAAMAEIQIGAQTDWRGQIASAGLGTKLANTVRSKVYPGRPSLDPAAYIWTKAPTIMLAYDQGSLITPTDGRRSLAIPTKNVPSAGRGKRMTPLQVETAFNQDLILRKKSPTVTDAFVDVAWARWRFNQGAAYGRRKSGLKPPKPKLVLMFILVRSVRVQKRLDIQRVADTWSDRYGELLDKNWKP